MHESGVVLSTFAGLLYARDPQLVWKGKDELDRSELTVPCMPIYISVEGRGRRFFCEFNQMMDATRKPWADGAWGAKSRINRTIFRASEGVVRYDAGGVADTNGSASLQTMAR